MSTATVDCPAVEVGQHQDLQVACDWRPHCGVPAVWSGRMTCGHSVTVWSCDLHRRLLDEAVAEVARDGYSCRTCHKPPHTVWRPL